MKETVFLEVPYVEKDLAKQLGARWNPVHRKWYVPEGRDLDDFAAWIPERNARCLEIPQDASETEGEENGVSLSAYLEEIGAVIQRGVRRAQWVRAELSQIRRTAGGHLQIELVEHDSRGQLTARLPAFLWLQKAERILTRFKEATGANLEAGLKVLLQLNLDHNPTYGLRALVEDIDPAYTLGDIARKREAIRKSLIDAQVFYLNREIAAATEFTHVVVLSPADAAGLGDFREDARRLEAHGLCRFTYYTAVFQGPEAARSLCDALKQIALDYGDHDAPDAVCIIRGGGAVTDLYWLNDRDLAEAVCRMKVPVLTGIGHERDNTILDEIANQRFDTPSKVIGHIAGTIYANASSAIEDTLIMLRLTQTMILSADAALHGLAERTINAAIVQLKMGETNLGWLWNQIRDDSQTGLTQAGFELDRLMDGVRNASELQIASQEMQLEQHAQSAMDRAALQIHDASQDLEALIREVLGMGPESTLRRGFALVRSNSGKPLTSRSQASVEKLLTLQFYDGQMNVNPDHGDAETNECRL